MPQYLISIYEDRDWAAGQSSEQFDHAWQDMMVAHRRFADQVTELGAKILDGNALQPVSTATTVRNDVVTDGPFLETKEVLGGYYLIEAEDLDQALAVAKLCPTPMGVDVRPVADTSGA